ncbi:hypothetical protein CANARDRAFT_6505 [[Candida] arabinofermentans NRRL YB-2248]|uniref:Trafficking protein particle complex subunit n=1 Tax=[Candida] arabinofermentans NRRL YB-2248 TaxID=983967 RepID=A0A1E4T5J9_9ASCO|nr:hypothetical protein CANARDRAFT_6505 [[Candida] arabinofermentans NRRL YB-2248]
MPIFSIYITSKSGSLLYQKDFKVLNNPITKQNSNDYLVIASTLHGVHAISAKLTPAASAKNYLSSKLPTNSNKTGLRMITTSQFKIYMNQTVTGLEIILFTSPDMGQTKISGIYDKIYQLYCDYVLKNPFYQLEMPIRCKLFDDKLLSVVTTTNV